MRRAMPLLLVCCVACEVAEGEPASSIDAAPFEDATPALDAALDAAPPALADAADTLLPVDRGPVDVAIEDAAPDAAPPAPDAAPDAAPPTPGTWEAPIPVDTLPATLEGDTREAPAHVADRYTPCAPAIREEGGEFVYAVTPDVDGTLVATVDDLSGDDVDVDVHLLDAPDPEACVARDNVELRWPVTAGETRWLVVDTWFDGAHALPDPFRLEVRLLPRDASGCPEDMVAVDAACVDRYEAPTRAGALPLVMYSFVEAEAWCAARAKRLCFDDEWIAACTGPLDTSYPYGDRHQPGVCRDDAVWRAFQPNLLAG